MMTHRTKSIVITRRAFAASLLASGALGIGIGEVAAPLAQSQARPVAVASKAPAACGTFATNVGHAFEVLGTILIDASKYPPLISTAALVMLSRPKHFMVVLFFAQVSHTRVPVHH